MNPKDKAKRIMLKLSGEAFAGKSGAGIDPTMLQRIAGQIKNLTEMGIEVAVVVGGGNIWRGSDIARSGMDRVTADYAGMLATVINALALQDALESLDCDTRLASSIRIEAVAEPYICRRVLRHWEKNRLPILAPGWISMPVSRRMQCESRRAGSNRRRFHRAWAARCATSA